MMGGYGMTGRSRGNKTVEQQRGVKANDVKVAD